MDCIGWMRLLARNRFAVHISCLHIAVIVSIVSVYHTLLRFIEEVLYAGRLRRMRLREAPLFIIGHWRTGTTLLHEMLILDERHGYPTTYECLEPNHFLLTEGFLTRLLWFFMPRKRPMDNMAAGWDRPQEDEFALAMMGQPSPYLTIAFPNHPPQYQEALSLEALPPHAVARWKRAFLGFLRRLTLRHGKRLILKSPTHTCRIKTLLEMFPDARFIHIVRDPYVVFPSTVNLWQSLYRTHGLQMPSANGLEEQVLRTFTYLYDKLEATRTLVHPSRFYEMRYEDLVCDPVGQMRAVYKNLDLGEFERVLPRLQEYLDQVAGYQTNNYELSAEQREEVTRRWGEVIRRYGYGPKEEAPAPPRKPALVVPAEEDEATYPFKAVPPPISLPRGRSAFGDGRPAESKPHLRAERKTMSKPA
jgi:hypothetical protein